MKRSVSILLTVCLVLSLLTTSVLAAESAGDTKGGQATETSENVQGGLAAGKGEDWQEVLDDQKIAEQDAGILPQVEGILITDKHYYSSNTPDIMVNAYYSNSWSWVALYPADANPATAATWCWYYCHDHLGDTDITEYKWTGTWPMPTGPYKVVLYGDDSRNNVLQSYYFFVGPATVSTNKSTYCINEPILVSTNYNQWEGWIGMHKAGATPGSGNSVSSYYVQSNNNMPGMGTSNVNIIGSGSGIMWGNTAYGVGSYTIGVFEHSAGYNRIASTNITVRAHYDKSGDANHNCDYCNAAGVTSCSDGSDANHNCDECNKANVSSHNYNQKNTASTYLKTAATCTSAAVYYYSCTCGAKGTTTFTSGSPLAHTYNQQKTTSTYLKSAATCTEAAVYYYSCTCGAKGTSTFTSGSAKGHSYTSVVTAPTCTAVGYTTYTCSVCQNSYTGNETAALGHTETTVNASEPDCENPGYTGDTVCSVCDAVIATGSEISALGHNYVATVTPPTCTEAGYTTHVCSRDSSHTYTDAEVPATGHTWGEYTLTKAPTHTETGEMTKSCTVCGAVHADVITVMKTPLLDLQIEFVNGRLVLTGIYDDYTNKTSYQSVLTHGIVLIPTASEGSAELSVNTNGRTKIEFNGFKTDGTVRYTFTPAGANVSYTVRAFVSYADPVTGEQVFAYSDILTGDYTTNEGRTLTTVRAD